MTNQHSLQAPLHNRLINKLHPSRFPKMTPVMGAIVAHLLGLPLFQPAITEVVVTSDGFVLARADGEAGANHFIGKYCDLIRNFYGLLAVAGLTPVERREAECLFAAKIGFFGWSNA
jgi:hypothetical protein